MNEHMRASELLPWMVNGRIDSAEARWLAAHLERCEACRGELAAQRRIRDALVREPTVEFAPQASFNLLWKRIESEPPEVLVPESGVPTAAPIALVSRKPTSRPMRPWMRVTLAAQAAAILVLCGVLWLRAGPSAYRTVTDPVSAPTASGPVIKAIFNDRVRLADVKEILASAGLMVAAGPSDAGVYTLVPRDPAAPVAAPSAAARLRTDPRVRFAEVSSQ